jgi:hypothetical protein
MTRNVRMLMLAALTPLLGIACASSGGGGLGRGPSSRAVTAEYGAPPDSVMQAGWEAVREGDIMARSLQRCAGDTADMARMESDWCHVPTV